MLNQDLFDYLDKIDVQRLNQKGLKENTTEVEKKIFIPETKLNKQFQQEAIKQMADNSNTNPTIDMGTMPFLYTELGIKDLEIKTNKLALKKAIGQDKKKSPQRQHNVPKEVAENLLSLVYNPKAVFKSLSTSDNPDGYVAILDANYTDEKGVTKPIIAILSPSKNGKGYTLIPTVYERDGFDSFIEATAKEGKILYIKSKGSDIWGKLDLLPRQIQNLNKNILYKSDIVNRYFIKQKENVKQEKQQIKEQAIKNGTFLKAPNGNKSNLSEDLWLTVRTKAFKNWFGDWELLEKKKQLDNAPVIKIQEKVFVDDKDNAKTARQQAIEWATETKLNEQYDTVVGTVSIDKTSIKDSLGHGYSQKKLDAVISLKDGFGNAIYLESIKDFEDNDLTNHYFVYPAIYQGQRELVFCRVRKDKNSNRLYVHEVFTEEKIKKESNTFQSNSPSQVKTSARGIALYKSILQKVINVNEKNISKVVDENGEPLVVYHGTSEVFSIFDKTKSYQGLFWFSSNYTKVKNGYDGATGKGIVMPTFVNIKNPANWDLYDKYSPEELENLKYDGLLLKDNDEIVVVAFNNNQIKSINNKGTFNKNNPDIYYQMGKDYYERQARNVELKNKDNRKVLLENGGTEEQADEIENLGALRHRIHSIDVNSLAIEDTEDVKNLRDGKINDYLKEAGLPFLTTTDAPLYSTQDTDDIIADYLGKDIENLTEKDKEDFNDKVVQEWAKWKEKVNNEIEKYLENIDKKYKTHYKPTGQLRLYQAAAMYNAIDKNIAKTFDEYYNFALQNKDNKKENNASFFPVQIKSGIEIQIPFNAFIHDYNNHILSIDEWKSIINNLENIDFGVRTIGIGNNNGIAVKLKIDTNIGKAGIILEFLKNGRVLLDTAFFDNENSIDNWITNGIRQEKQPPSAAGLTSIRTSHIPTTLNSRILTSEAKRSIIDVFNFVKKSKEFKSLPINKKGQKYNKNIINTYSQDQDNPRGATTIYGKDYYIDLFTNADKSTLQHELAHVYLHRINELAQDKTATDEVKRIKQLLDDFLGVPELSNGMYYSKAQQEKFATNFESYLKSGKAPNAKLKSVFERFAEWLANIYDSIKDELPKISKEAKELFDTILTRTYDVPDSNIYAGKVSAIKEVIQNIKNGVASEVDGITINDVENLLKIAYTRKPSRPSKHLQQLLKDKNIYNFNELEKTGADKVKQILKDNGYIDDKVDAIKEVIQNINFS